MKERPASGVEAGCSAASAPLRIGGLRSAAAALEANGVVCPAKQTVGAILGNGPPCGLRIVNAGF